MSAPKHLLNDPKHIVIDSLKGLVGQNANIRLNEEYKVISRASVPKNQVSIISGGGSGHEPSHAGFVGAGLLTAAVCGNVFASPNVGQIKKALETVNTEAGTLIVIMQYTGDVLHFGLAGEQYRAQNPNSKVRLLAVGDDISVGRAQGKMVGRRGMAGTVLCYKLGGALAAKGGDLDAVYNVAQFVADRTATIGAGLDHTHIPGTGPSETHLASDQVEVGMGIHNEPGLETAPLTTTKALLQKMIDLATSTSDEDRSFVPFQLDGKDEVVLMVNNLGSISELELGGVTGTALEILGEMKVKVRRVLAGTFMTSLNMPGFSVSLFLLPRESESTGYKTAELLELLDADGDAPGWKWHSKSEPGEYSPASADKSTTEEAVAHKTTGKVIKPTSGKAFIDALKQACEDVKVAEPEITRMDTIAGDGDCGTTLKRGGEGILQAIEDKRVSETDVIQAVLTIAEQVEIDMDGTSGALYSIYLNGLASGLRSAAESQKSDTTTPEVWAEALSQARDTLYKYTRARTPSRTLVDPLEAFTNQFKSDPNDFPAAVKAGVDAAAATINYTAKAGRAAYVGREELQRQQVPDPGAHGVGVILGGIQKVLNP